MLLLVDINSSFSIMRFLNSICFSFCFLFLSIRNISFVDNAIENYD